MILSVYMKSMVENLMQLESLAPSYGGVFSASDLKNLFLSSSSEAANQKLKPFLKAGFLTRACRGFYVTKKFDLERLSARLCPDSAISFGNVLAQEMVIGSIPQKTVYAVKRGKSRTYRLPTGQIVHLGFTGGQNSNAWFGYDVYKQGVRYADKEKAFLDTLYFYQLGHRFSFNVYSDINVSVLDSKKIEEYLRKYKNPKFKQFVKGVLIGK